MSAYNWIVVEERCPACRTSGQVRAQTHVASSYDGDDRGRFHDAEYRIGQPMRWWDRDDPRFDGWPAEGDVPPSDAKNARVTEACYATCAGCGASLCVLARFHENTPEAVESVTTEDDWPAGYPR